MNTFLRFTETEPTSTEVSYNGFNGQALNGLCCFELNNNESLYVQVRKIARKNATYANNSNNVCFLFEGDKIENNFNNEGVIAKYKNTIERLELGFNKDFGYFIK